LTNDENEQAVNKRASGILLHLTSLPSDYGIGDMGSGAYRFVDFLAAAKQRFWQILPLSPTEPAHGNSPYYSSSAFAGNPLLISPEILYREGLLTEAELASTTRFPRGNVDYGSVGTHKRELLSTAFQHFQGKEPSHEYGTYCSENAYWLNDYALFKALKSHHRGAAWNEWPQEHRDRHPESLAAMERHLHGTIEQEKFCQYIFAKQWKLLRQYCNDRGIQIIGDLPIYVTYDSADLWSHPELFKLDEDKRPLAVAGVPPDYFSETGQLWGNPVYRWDELREKGYEWWEQRIIHNLRMFDLIRVDHFRGFVAYWEVPAHAKDAREGKWVEAPAEDFFDHLKKNISPLPIIAEDLGVITPDVEEVMRHFGFPGMKLLVFAFGDDLPINPYIPHNLERNCVAYTGTHDNNPVRGWIEEEASFEEKSRLFQYLGREVPANELPWEMVRLVMMSVANTVIFPMQDILGLGGETRMNRPATAKGNWQWRLRDELLSGSVAGELAEMTSIYGRSQENSVKQGKVEGRSTSLAFVRL
jgi:4-alpha-glucanotransferase